MNLRDKLKIYIITDSSLRDEIETAEMALKGGATAIQLRMKNHQPDRKIYENGLKIRKLTLEYDSLFIIDDRVDIALAIDADGVHLGDEDIPVYKAREIAPTLIIGRTVRSDKEVKKYEKYVNYFGAGSVFKSQTKDAMVIGVDGLEKIVKSTEKPVVAIGGINHENLCKVLKTGVDGVAMISAILTQSDIASAVRRVKEIMRSC